MNQTQNDNVTVMTRKMNTVGGWCGMLYLPSVAFGWFVLGGYFPLHAPTDTEAQIAGFYQEGLISKRIGLIILMWAAVCLMIFASATASHLSRIEGRFGPLSCMMLLGGYAGAMVGFYPGLWWLTAAYRPERSAELIYLLNDTGWLQLVGGVSMVVTMYIAVAVASLMDTSKHPTFPRWTAFLSFWALVMFIPGQLLFQFQEGPFAWDGILAFWVPGGLYFIWYSVIGYLVVKASSREKQQSQLS